MEDPSSSPQPATPKPKAKAQSKKTKADIETELAEAKAEIARLRSSAAELLETRSQLDEEGHVLDNEWQKLEQREALLEWGFEQQEAVLHEAVTQGLELGHAVLEQKYLLEQEIAEKLSDSYHNSSRRNEKRT